MEVHQHEHSTLSSRNLFFSVALNIGITLAQIAGGIFSGSTALLSDALHNFSDVLSLSITYITHRLAKRKKTKYHTFGYQRAEILAAFINSAALLIVATFLCYEAIIKIFIPEKINSVIVIWLAAASIVVNGVSVLLIRKNSKTNINIKSAYLHLFTDMLTSVALLIGGIFMKFYGWYRIDGFVTLFIALYLIYSGWQLFVDSINIIMLFSPKNIDPDKLKKEIEAIDGIKNLHHLHLWRLTDNKVNMEAHIDVEKDLPISVFEKQLVQIYNVAYKMGINHVTIQPEYTLQDDKQLIHK